MAEIEAVIWDLDGVLANTASYHLSAWQEIFSKRGVKFTEEDFRRSFGQRNDTIIKNTLGEQTTQGEIEAIAEEKEATFRRMIGQKIKPFPGAVELVYSLRRQGVKLAIASSTPIENIRLITSSLGVANCFQAIVTGHDVTEGKPSPQVFLLAAKRLGAEPENCIVIEDAVAGVTAAKRAGMHCVAVTSTRSRQSLKQADLIVRTLEEISIKDLEGLFRPS
jgi:beta-phosphoglucomutase family hydrolase